MNKKLVISISIIVVILSVLIFKYNRVESFNWKKDSRQMYNIKLRIVFNSSLAGMGQFFQNMEIRGILNFRIFNIEENIIRAGFQISPIKISGIKGKNPYITKLFSQLFFVDLEKNGRLKKFYFSNVIAEEDEDKIKNIITSFQAVIPDSFFSHWKTIELDSNGKYRAVYSISEKNSIQKKKIRYLSVNDDNLYSNKMKNTSIKIKKSKFLFERDKNYSWLKSLKGNDLVTIYTDGDPVLKISNSISLNIMKYTLDETLDIWRDNLSFDKEISLWNSLLKNKIPISLLSNVVEFKNKFGNKTLFQVIDSVFLNNKKFNASSIKTLINYLKLNLNAAEKIPEYLLRKKLNSNQRVLLVHVLSRVGDSKSQIALSRILQGESFRKESRTQAAIGFGSISKPDDESVNILLKMYDERFTGKKYSNHIGATSILSLGAIANSFSNQLDDKYQTKSEEIKTKISTELKEENEINSKAALLHAAGNTTDANMIGVITKSFDDENPRIRSAAVTSLLYINDPVVNNILCDEITEEKNINVRKAIVVTLYKKSATEDSVNTILEEVKKEENDIVRGEMYRYLLKNRNFPGVKSSLKEILLDERSTEHKKIIHRAIYTRK